MKSIYRSTRWRLCAGAAASALLLTSVAYSQAAGLGETAAQPVIQEIEGLTAKEAKKAERKAEKAERKAEKAERKAEKAERKAEKAAAGERGSENKKARKKAGETQAGKQPAAPAAKSESAENEKPKAQDDQAGRKKKRADRKAEEPKTEPAEKARETRRGARPDAATAETTNTEKNADGTRTVVRKRRDGATVRVTRDSKGRVIHREVKGERKQDDLSRVRKRDVVEKRETKLDNGRTRTVTVRDDGTRMIIVRDGNGNVTRRTIQSRDGRDQADFRGGNRRETRRDGVRFNVFLPFGLDIVPDRYVIDLDRAEPELIEETLMADPVVRITKRYDIDEIRYDADVRSAVRRIDVDTIVFDSGEYRIPPDQIGRLDRVASVISRLIGRRDGEVFLIEGHTDAVGDFDYNLELSQLRADEVKQALVDSYDIPPHAVVAQGYGEQYLKVDTDRAERLNRRVSLRRITPLLRR